MYILAKFFGNSAEFWTNLNGNHEFRKARNENMDILNSIREGMIKRFISIAIWFSAVLLSFYSQRTEAQEIEFQSLYPISEKCEDRIVFKVLLSKNYKVRKVELIEKSTIVTDSLVKVYRDQVGKVKLNRPKNQRRKKYVSKCIVSFCLIED